jgi:hypothetical protein
MPARKILCEIKRDYHPDVWTAPDDQLEWFYAHDPEALGFGIYLVFWFDGRRSAIPLPPEGQPRPTSAAEMESMWHTRLQADRAARTAVMVIDVTTRTTVAPIKVQKFGPIYEIFDGMHRARAHKWSAAKLLRRL